ncbi:sensor histidine kinase [Microbacterium sp. bgisy203]|uniref:sensor histidine kinase n=1 Tax=Microbacterium sp. bgisy203 TaxID=3413799 RepID=UPI003D74EC92
MAPDDTVPVRQVSFRADARTRSIWLWQLSLAVVVVVVAVAVLLLAPAVLASAPTAGGIVMILALTMMTLVLPWHRAGRSAVATLPLADILAIGLLAWGSELRFGFLWVFPLAWLASHFRVPWVVAGLSLVATVVVLDALTHTADETSTLRFLVVLLSLTFISITIYNSARRTRAFNRLLRRQADRLEATLERVRAQERRVNQMLNGLDSAVARVDREGRLLGINEAYLALYGIDPRDTSRPPTSVEYDERGGTALREADRPAARAARGELFSDERLWLFDAEGRWHIVSASTRELVHGPAESETTLLVIRDITEAVEAENARRTLATTVTHELANPLTAIVGYTDLLLEDDLPPRSRERLELIEAAGTRMERLISEVLRAGGREAGLDPRRRLDARALMAATVESFLPAAAAGDVSLELREGPEAPIDADAFRLRQVFDNLVSNAVKYTPRSGSVEVTVAAVGGDAVIRVTDTGIGIGAHDLPHVFDDYFRAETARDAGLPGTGLGMGISRTIVEEHGGTLELTSHPGAGTTATIRIPLDEGEGPA